MGARKLLIFMGCWYRVLLRWLIFDIWVLSKVFVFFTFSVIWDIVGIFASLAALMFNCVRKEDIDYSPYDEGEWRYDNNVFYVNELVSCWELDLNLFKDRPLCYGCWCFIGLDMILLASWIVICMSCSDRFAWDRDYRN